MEVLRKRIPLMTAYRRQSGTAAVASLIMLLLPLMLLGCQLGLGAQPAPNPILPPTPTLEERRVQTGPEIGNNTKVIEGNLHVWYIPCPQDPSPPFEWVAPISVTDLNDGSKVYLNRDGTLKASPKPNYKTEEGRTRLEAALKDDAIIKQIVARPECSE